MAELKPKFRSLLKRKHSLLVVGYGGDGGGALWAGLAPGLKFVRILPRLRNLILSALASLAHRDFHLFEFRADLSWVRVCDAFNIFLNQNRKANRGNPAKLFFGLIIQHT